MALTISHLSEIPASLRDDWNDLALRSNSSIFQTFEWNDCWLRSFGASFEPVLLVAQENSRLCGIAPLLARKGRRFLTSTRSTSFVGAANYASDYCDFLIEPGRNDVLNALLEEMTDSSYGWTEFQLTNLLPGSRNPEQIELFLNHKQLPYIKREAGEAPAIDFSLSSGHASDRKSLRKRSGWFERNGELSFVRIRGGDCEHWLNLFFEQHITRRAETDSPSQFHQGEQKVFYRHLADELDKAGWLHFSAALFNGSPIAFHFGFEYQGTLVYYKPTFDVAFAVRSPGDVLLKHLLEYCEINRVQVFDFSIGSESYKYKYANTIRKVVNISVFGNKGAYFASHAKERVKPLVKKVIGLCQ